MEIKLDLLQTVGLAVCVFLLGRWIKSKVKFFQKYFIPAPVIGGLIASVVIFAALADHAEITPQPEEIAEAFWLPIEEAATRLTYERDRKIMRDAFAHILKYHAPAE